MVFSLRPRPWLPKVLAAAGLATLGLACNEEAGEPARDAVYFLDHLHQLEDLPLLEDSLGGLSRNYDPEGGNATDGSVYPWVDGYRNTLLSIDGPGCLHRISTGDLEGAADTRIELRLDHTLRLEMSVGELFDPESGPFAGGLTLTGDYPEVRYPTIRMPIPFAEHAEVRLVSPERAWGVFWQIGYTTYTDATAVETLELPFDSRTRAAFDRAGSAWDDALTGARRPGAADISLTELLAPGQSLAWSEPGCGTIERLALRVSPNEASAWQGLQLRMRWDIDNPVEGEDTRAWAIDLPVATFMGSGVHADQPEAWFRGLLMGQQGNQAYLRLPMPYREGVQLELVNPEADESGLGEPELDVELELWRRDCVEQPPNSGYLHASVETALAASAQSPRSGPMQVPVHRLLDREGRGKIVGTMLRIDWPYDGLWWGEGDWQIWADEALDSWPPRYHGTGTEEFYDGGWTRFDRKALSGAIKQRPGLVTVYGFLLNDAFNYREQIRVQVETVGLGLGDEVILAQNRLWSSTIYWYDERP